MLKYWNSVPEELRPKQMQDACKHRHKYLPPATPEHYWSIAFPNTQECIERGTYMNNNNLLCFVKEILLLIKGMVEL